MKFGIKAILSVLLGFLIVGNISLATNWNLPGVKIITREQRGVDESIRIRSAKSSTSSSTTQTPAQIEAARISSVRNAWMAKNYPNAWKYEASVTMTGDKYWIYPDYFNYHKTKIIIHHTATDYNPGWTKQEVMKQIQLMYRYHVIDRDFGDIGYNFIIDQLGNIYEGRHGGEGAVGMHTANNNASSIGISLMGNFENDVPTEAQLGALVNLVTALARYYNIDPNGTTYTFQTNTTKDPYVVAKQNPTILGHKDVAVTACPGKNLYSFLPKLREEVSFRLKNNIVGDMPIPTSWTDSLSKMENKTSSISKTSVKKNKKSFSESLKEIQTSNPNLLYSAGDKMKDRYKGKLVEASQKSAKILKKYTTNDLKNLLKQDISVLLYELTTEYDTFQITCDTSCSFNIDGAAYNLTGANITITQNGIIIDANSKISADNISVKSNKAHGIVKILNYDRKSYVGIPWNEFKGSISFKEGIYPLSNGSQKAGIIVVNTLPFSDYMKGIVETNDTETLEKNKIMALISKNYALFYLNGDNHHPSITDSSNYTAIDDPEFFQKYVGAGLEKTLTKRYQALNATEDKIIMYNNYLPILPYFNCSPGFTLSAEEKRGWIDTPYLQTTFDFGACNDFIGHGVGLAGQGAEYLAKQGLTYDEIIKYYYKGVEIKNI